MSVTSSRENIHSSSVNKKSIYDSMDNLHCLSFDGSLWRQFISEKNNSEGSNQKKYSAGFESKFGVLGVEGSSISSDIVKGICKELSGGEIKFIIKFPGLQNINVCAFENRNFWNVNIVTNENNIRKKIKKFKKNIENSVSQELKKRVVVCVK